MHGKPKPWILRRHGTIQPGGRSVAISALHPAHKYARSIFPSRVYDPDEVDRVQEALMSMRQRRSYGSKAPSQAKAEAALRAMLVMRRSLDGVTVEALSRAYNVKPARIDVLLREESKRRARG